MTFRRSISWLDVIRRLRDDEGLKNPQIAARIGWTDDQVKKYSALLTAIVPEVLQIAKAHQIGRGTEEVPSGTFNFTEGWFRTSGLYDLPAKYQIRIMEAFIADKCRWTKDGV